MLARAWHKDTTESNIHAVLKQTAIVVNSKEYLYWRLLGAAAACVPASFLGDKVGSLKEDSCAGYDASR